VSQAGAGARGVRRDRSPYNFGYYNSRGTGGKAEKEPGRAQCKGKTSNDATKQTEDSTARLGSSS
jgi:hypothetical protein